jgi:hypothetical protein
VQAASTSRSFFFFWLVQDDKTVAKTVLLYLARNLGRRIKQLVFSLILFCPPSVGRDPNSTGS